LCAYDKTVYTKRDLYTNDDFLMTQSFGSYSYFTVSSPTIFNYEETFTVAVASTGYTTTKSIKLEIAVREADRKLTQPAQVVKVVTLNKDGSQIIVLDVSVFDILRSSNLILICYSDERTSLRIQCIQS
jgi:hypothetical protein